ncbi:chorismate mutase [Vallitalea okinawensis]|uniref:chorismate mutase n=1 Tax=Vallitalea okinawensis TaxID=2078660 RepID=UPI000CFB807F|nr:chorismate mutase [Vallitalea okinawensis]
MIAVRGATTVKANTKEDILEATNELIEMIIKENNMDMNDIISITFTATKDLDAVYPAVAARNLGITTAGLLCMQEMYVEKSLKKCIRVLIHASSDRMQKNVIHIYLNEAVRLRPDLDTSIQ